MRGARELALDHTGRPGRRLRLVNRGGAPNTDHMTTPSLPPARLVREARGPVAPSVPLRHRLARLGPPARRLLAPLRLAVLYALAFWPLTAVVLFSAAMIWAAGNGASP